MQSHQAQARACQRRAAKLAAESSDVSISDAEPSEEDHFPNESTSMHPSEPEFMPDNNDEPLLDMVLEPQPEVLLMTHHLNQIKVPKI